MTLHDDICRRAFLTRSASGLGALSLSALLGRDLLAAVPGAIPLGAPRAKRVIFLHMRGGSNPPPRTVCSYPSTSRSEWSSSGRTKYVGTSFYRT